MMYSQHLNVHGRKNIYLLFFFSFLKISDKSIIIFIHICKKVFSVNFFCQFISPTLSLKSNVYLAYHIVCLDYIFAFDSAISEMWGRRKN